MNRLQLFSTTVLMGVLAACDMSKFEPITIAVYPTTHKCAIESKDIDCEKIGEYLRDTMKVQLDHHIDVSYTGSDQPSKDDPMVDQVANTVRAAGFKDVNAARFDLGPK